MKKTAVFSAFAALLVSILFVTCAALEYDGYVVKLSGPIEQLSVLSSSESAFQAGYSEDIYVVDDKATVDTLVREGKVEYAEPNYILEPLGEVPSDTKYSSQWSLGAINYLSLYENGYDGSGTKIAVVDTGLDTTHADFLDANISSLSKNFLGDGTHADEYHRDQLGHGTFVTSQIAAVTDNKEGIAGIADGAEIIVLRCVSASSSDKYAYDEAYDSGSGSVFAVSDAICYAVDNGADVINISLGMTVASTRLDEAVNYANSHGVIVVAAVGNKGSSVLYYPAGCNGVIGAGSVSVSGSSYSRSYFSQYNDSVDVVAPGGSVFGIRIYPNADGKWYTTTNASYTTDSGTSYSSPVVASLAAVAKQVNPYLDGEDFLSLMAVTSCDFGSVGYDKYYGYGLADAKELLCALTETEYPIEYVLDDATANMPGTYAESYKLNRKDELLLPVPIRAGYIFTGWHFNSDLTDDAISALPMGTLGNVADTDGKYSIAPIKLYAAWKEVAATATEITDGEVFDRFSSYGEGAEISLYDVSFDGTVSSSGVNIEVAFDGEISFVYFVNGDYMVLVESEPTQSGVSFNAKEDGIYVISDKSLVLYGDANGDGYITLIDTLRIMKRVSDSSIELSIAAADCNMDCSISVLDILKSLSILLN